jgi:glutamate dehydrogenase
MSSTNRIDDQKLMEAVNKESKKFQECYLWLKTHMPKSFFEEINDELLTLVTHNLIDFDLQQFFSHVHLKHLAIVLCIDSPDADLRILQNYSMHGIKNYRSFVSEGAPPITGANGNLRVATLFFTEAIESREIPFSLDVQQEIKKRVLENNPQLTEAEIDRLLGGMNSRFLSSLKIDLLLMGLKMFVRAQSRDTCQYEVTYNKDWKEKDIPSMQIVLAWRNTPKQYFLYRIARIIHRHGLVMKRVNATYVDAYSKERILIMAIGLDGKQGQAAWDAADIDDFLKELVTVKHLSAFDYIEQIFVDSKLLRGNLGSFLRASLDFIHQALLQVDIHLYTHANCEEALCRHPELTIKLGEAFEAKFHPKDNDLNRYVHVREEFLSLVEKLDTGHETNDIRRKNVLKQGMNFIDYTLKTNFYQHNKSCLSFRLDPAYLDHIPFDRKQRFPLLPFAIFYVKNNHLIGFHIRFKDLARGGVRTIFPEQMERALIERNAIFTECYNLAYTQNKKNKDIPEGGAKAVIFLKPFERLDSEVKILSQELLRADVDPIEIDSKVQRFKEEQKLEYLYQSQRSFVSGLMALINCTPDGGLVTKNILDYWKKPEYLYLGPDENMHDAMILWIAAYSKKCKYKPGGSFISGKPDIGINHKQYGVTSLGVNVYMREVLKALGIDPATMIFTLKISGGPDGDVAGNQIHNLYRFFPNTAKVLALTDVSGTIFDPIGLDLEELNRLFLESKPIKYYPPEKLHSGGFLLDKNTKREQTAYAQQTLCWRKHQDKVVQDWLSGNEMNALYRSNVHQTRTDIFIPAGGRPRTLNDANYQEFLDDAGIPTSKAIVEGANLYLTQWARRALEELGVLVIKDSSANKTGVICSSFEVLAGLTLTDEEFLAHKEELVKEILEILQQRALDEAVLLLQTHYKTKAFLTDISEEISTRINAYNDQLLEYLGTITLSKDVSDPLIKCFLNYCPPLLRTNYRDRLLEQIPDNHKKAIIACRIASKLVYKRGLSWSPTIVDVLPLVLSDSI